MSKWQRDGRYLAGIRDGFEAGGDVSCEGCFEKKLIIERLREEKKQLQERIKRLEEGTVIPVGSHSPPSQMVFKGKSTHPRKGERGGARPGHKGNGRKSHNIDEVDAVVEVPAPKRCPICEAELRRHSERCRSILDAAQMKVRKIVYKIERAQCPECKKLQESRIPILRGSLYGSGLLAQVANLHYLQGVPLGRITELLGPGVNAGSVLGALQRIAKKWEPALTTLISEYRNAPVKHADETGWRVDGEPGWSWLFSSSTVSIFECQNTRGSVVPKRIFGSEPLEGVLVVDRYTAYNKLPCRLQYCYAHLLREVKKIEDEFSENEDVSAFCSEFGHLLSEAMRLAQRPISDEQYYEQAQSIAAGIQKLVNQQPTHVGIESIQGIFKKRPNRFFEWVHDRRVPAHNNLAERELRTTVIARKVSFGSQSPAGAKTRAVLMSILATAKKRLKNVGVDAWFAKALTKMALQPDLNPALLLPPIPP